MKEKLKGEPVKVAEIEIQPGKEILIQDIFDTLLRSHLSDECWVCGAKTYDLYLMLPKLNHHLNPPEYHIKGLCERHARMMVGYLIRKKETYDAWKRLKKVNK